MQALYRVSLRLAHRSGYSTAVLDGAVGQAFHARWAVAGFVAGAPVCPPSARAFLLTLRQDVKRGTQFPTAGLPVWGRITLPVHPLLLVPASVHGPALPVIPADTAAALASRPAPLIGPTPVDRKSTRLNSSHSGESRMPSSA